MMYVVYKINIEFKNIKNYFTYLIVKEFKNIKN